MEVVISKIEKDYSKGYFFSITYNGIPKKIYGKSLKNALSIRDGIITDNRLVKHVEEEQLVYILPKSELIFNLLFSGNETKVAKHLLERRYGF